MTTKVPTITPKTKLPNGAVLIDERAHRMGGAVVLCSLPHNTVTPFVTWRTSPHDEGCYWGHYAKTLGEATKDFSLR